MILAVVNAKTFALVLLLASHADAQQHPRFRTVWTLVTTLPSGAQSQAPMDPQGSQFRAGLWTCRYTRVTTVTTSAGPQAFHRSGRELECQDGVGLVEISTSCDIDAPDAKSAELSLTRVDDRDHKTSYLMQCRTEAIP